MILDQVCSVKEDLISVFEDLFGQEHPDNNFCKSPLTSNNFEKKMPQSAIVVDRKKI